MMGIFCIFMFLLTGKISKSQTFICLFCCFVDGSKKEPWWGGKTIRLPEKNAKFIIFHHKFLLPNLN